MNFQRGRPPLALERLRELGEDVLAEAAMIEVFAEHMESSCREEIRLLGIGTPDAIGRTEVLLQRDLEYDAGILDAVQILLRAQRRALEIFGCEDVIPHLVAAQHTAIKQWAQDRKGAREATA